MIAKLIVFTRKRALDRLFVDSNLTDRLVVTITGNHSRKNTREIVVVVRLLINFRTVRDARQIVDRPILLDERCIGTTAVSRGPPVIVHADRPRQLGRRNRWVELNIINPHPVSTALSTVIDSLEGHDVIES